MKDKLKKVVFEFNKLRYPECKAKIISFKNGTVEVEFSGTKASFACCFDENFIDLKYYFLDYLNLNFEIKEILKVAADRFIVKYKLL
ncbi:MAG: hypothetical protein NZ928_00070 [Endomicrobia bacterium]|nr:hypothetical protein [Endomicrobiia bacterium]MDW8055936.1 hypothetical protein [Elusimicrobiota bacterium]